MPKPRPTIVVVDDDASMNQAIERLLNATGYRALTFPSAEALLEADVPSDTACLVFDVHLPGLSGFELYQRLVRNGTDLPVIFITAYDDPDSQARANSAGAMAYLTKPFPGQKLIAAICRAIGSSPAETSSGKNKIFAPKPPDASNQ